MPDNSVVAFPLRAKYRTDNIILVQERRRLRIECNGATFRVVTNGDELGGGAATQNRYAWSFLMGDHIVWRNGTVIGANPNAGTGDAAYVGARESQHCFAVRGTKGCLIEYATCSDPYGDFCYVGTTGVVFEFEPAQGVTFRYSECDRNGRMGFACVGGSDIHCVDNSMFNIRRSAFDIEPNDPVTIERVYYLRNTIGPHRLLAFSCVGATNAVMRDIWYADNSLTGASGPDFAVSTLETLIGAASNPVGNRSRFRILRNTSNRQDGGPSMRTIGAINVSDLIVDNNTQPHEAGRDMHILKITGCTNVRARGNACLNSVGTILDGGGNTDFCSGTDNQIGNPLSFEDPSPFPCS